MKKSVLILLIGSLILNIFFVVSGVFWVAKKGGIPYVTEKIRSLQKPIRSPLYSHKVELYKSFPNSQEDICFVGDSITAQCNWDELFNNFNCKNRGIDGDRSEGVLNRLQEITRGHPKKVFIMIGINDIKFTKRKDKSLNLIEGNLKKIVSTIASDSPKTHIYLQSVLPLNKSKYLYGEVTGQSNIILINEYIKKLASSEGVTYIDLFPYFSDSAGELRSDLSDDGIHLNAKGYYIWKDKIIEYVK